MHIVIYYIKAPQQSQKLHYQKIYFHWNHLVNWELKKWNFGHKEIPFQKFPIIPFSVKHKDMSYGPWLALNWSLVCIDFSEFQ